ncbi:hypothetical protein [Alkalisalibacterium limincola]|uniref:Flippase-like domain-containing protein n=1 Tax=Alkalisalibacterium limincola TaxID=2699169 RepID=A0A5C8KXB8_9GAMM|nr:hypothetical protein [Alkalisalibacterium limincola]TXK65029.1 hypothetical protein FU658_04330 [Alkalisalibacterium limincola]
MTVTAAALGGVVILWWEAWGDVGVILASVDTVDLALALAFTMASIWLVFLAYVVLVRRALSTVVAIDHLAHLYFTAQLLKHLPGRIWGIGYQALAGSQLVRPSLWVAASLVHLGAAIAMVVWVAAIVLVWSNSVLGSVLIAGAGIAMFLLVRFVFSARPLKRLVQRSTRIPWLGDIPVVVGAAGAGGWMSAFMLLLAGTLGTYVSWVFLASASGFPDNAAAIHLAAFYILAWLAGYLAVVTPGGLGVRELVFAGLASEFPPELVAALAILGRLLLMTSDVIFGIAVAPIGRKPGSKKELE